MEPQGGPRDRPGRGGREKRAARSGQRLGRGLRGLPLRLRGGADRFGAAPGFCRLPGHGRLRHARIRDWPAQPPPAFSHHAAARRAGRDSGSGLAVGNGRGHCRSCRGGRRGGAARSHSVELGADRRGGGAARGGPGIDPWSHGRTAAPGRQRDDELHQYSRRGAGGRSAPAPRRCPALKPTLSLGEPRASDLHPAAVRPPRWRVLLSFTRPFTLLPPLLGVVSGAITAFGSAHNPDPLRRVNLSLLATVCLGSLCAALLNAASNGINQVYDLEIDRKNKPGRPLVSGALRLEQAKRFSALLYALAILPTWFVMIYPHARWSERLLAPARAHECFWIFVAGLVFTLVYSVPAFGRTKRNGFWANLTIAVPRGCLLKVAGWSMVASVAHPEPWFIGGVFFLFLLGASTTKDFSDMEGDAAHGCITLPIRYGVR